MQISQFVEKRSLLVLAFIAGGITFKIFAPISIGLLFLVLFWERKSIEWKFEPRLLLLSFPFILALFGNTYSTNQVKAWEDTGIVLPFLFFPFGLLFMRHLLLEKKNRVFLIKAFQWGVMIRLLLDVVRSSWYFMDNHDFASYFYVQLDPDTNVFSTFVCFALLVEVEGFIKAKSGFGNRLFFGVLFFFLVLLQSRIAIACFFIGAFSLHIWSATIKRSVYLLLPLSLLVGLYFHPTFGERMRQGVAETKALNSIQSTEKSHIFKECMTAANVRKNALICSWFLLLERPLFGWGTGDWRDALLQKYQEKNMICNVIEKTAPHNQYLRFGLKYGFLGVCLFLVLLFFLFNHASWENYGTFSLVLTIGLTALGYDIFEVGSGAPGMAFLVTLLFLHRNKKA